MNKQQITFYLLIAGFVLASAQQLGIDKDHGSLVIGQLDADSIGEYQPSYQSLDYRVRRSVVEDIPAPIEGPKPIRDGPLPQPSNEREVSNQPQDQSNAEHQQNSAAQPDKGISGLLSRVADRLHHLSESTRNLQSRLSSQNDQSPIRSMSRGDQQPQGAGQPGQPGHILSGVSDLLGGLMNIGAQAQQAGMALGAQAAQQGREIGRQAQLQAKDFNKN